MLTRVFLSLMSLALGLACFGAAMAAGDHNPDALPAGLDKPTATSQLYPLDICIVTGEKLGSMGDVVIYNHEGREIRFCCQGCVSKFEANADDYLGKIDAAIIEQQLADYPMKNTCIAQGCDITPDTAQKVVVGNRLLLGGCMGCATTIREDPEKYIAMLDAAVIKAQLATYPSTTCPVTDEPLGGMGEVVDVVYAGKLVRFCCAGCIKAFSADPAKYMAKIYGS